MEGHAPTGRFWPGRLRWRLRGAWLWPTFLVLTAVDGVLLEYLPIAGDGPAGLVPALILAGFFNLFAVLAAFAAVPLIRRRRHDLPRPIAHNYAATAAVIVVFAAVLAGGLVHRPQRLGEQHDRDVAARAVHDTILARDELAVYRRGVGGIDSLRLQEDLYRVCVPGPDPKRYFCAFVNTAQSPPGLQEDTSKESNARFAGPGAIR